MTPKLEAQPKDLILLPDYWQESLHSSQGTTCSLWGMIPYHRLMLLPTVEYIYCSVV